MTAIPTQSRFYGWTVVWAALVLAIFGWGVGFYGPPVFLHAIMEARGWSLPLVSAAVTTHFLVGALVVANLPKFYARFGLPNVTKAGAAALAFGVLGWACAASPWQLFAATVFSGAGWVAMGAAAINAIIAPWFVRGRPAALAMAYNGASIGGVIFSPLWVAAIGAIGFTQSAFAFGFVMVATVWLLADRVFSRTPQSMGMMPDGGSADTPVASIAPAGVIALSGDLVWRDRRFLTLASGMALSLFAQIGLIAHLFSLMLPSLGMQVAGLAMGLATACAIAGRTLVGWLMPPGADRRLVAGASTLVQIFGSITFLLAGGENVELMLLGVILFGAGIGNATSLPPLIAQSEFLKEDVARIVPLIVAIGQGTYAFAPAMFGLVREYSGSVPSSGNGGTPLFFSAVAGVQGLSILCLMAGRRKPTGREAA